MSLCLGRDGKIWSAASPPFLVSSGTMSPVICLEKTSWLSSRGSALCFWVGGAAGQCLQGTSAADSKSFRREWVYSGIFLWFCWMLYSCLCPCHLKVTLSGGWGGSRSAKIFAVQTLGPAFDPSNCKRPGVVAYTYDSTLGRSMELLANQWRSCLGKTARWAASEEQHLQLTWSSHVHMHPHTCAAHVS